MRATLDKRQQTVAKYQAKYYNKTYKPIEYRVDNKVLLSTKNLKLDIPKKKIEPKFLGPYRIINVIGT